MSPWAELSLPLVIDSLVSIVRCNVWPLWLRPGRSSTRVQCNEGDLVSGQISRNGPLLGRARLTYVLFPGDEAQSSVDPFLDMTILLAEHQALCLAVEHSLWRACLLAAESPLGTVSCEDWLPLLLNRVREPIGGRTFFILTISQTYGRCSQFRFSTQERRQGWCCNAPSAQLYFSNSPPSFHTERIHV